MNTEQPKTNLLKDINNNPIFITIGIGIVLIVIAIFLIIFKVSVPTTSGSSLPKTSDSIASNILIILFFIMLIFIGSISLLPSLKELKSFLLQISNVTYVVLYTIFLILFFRLAPSDIINTYSSIITPTTIVISIFMFYKAFKENYAEIFNINYERIKTLILFFCLITLFIVYYVTDPGGYITKYFGYSALLTIILSVFILLYLIILITIPGENKPSTEKTNDNLFNRFSNFSVWGSISFIAFLISVTIGIYTSGFNKNLDNDLNINNQSGFSTFFKNKTESASVIILLLIASIFWVTLLVLNIFPEFPSVPNIKNIPNIEKFNLFKKGLLVLFGLVISGLIIAWLSYNIQSLTNNSSIVSFILNIFLIIVVLAIIYKTIYVQFPYGNSKKNAFFDLLMNAIFYIPCLFTTTFDSVMKLFIDEYDSTTTGSLLLLLLAIVLLLLYFLLPFVYKKINLQGGKLLVNNPVYTNSIYSLGNYKELNESENYDYQYAISFWFFADAVPPNTNSNSVNYTSILNFGNKPNILYNTQKNSLVVTMPSNVKLYNTNKEILNNLDLNDNVILYKNDNILLQKWNNIIINYNGGVLDIFLNSELVKSVSGVVPYYTLDNLTIGEDNGVHGGICNVVYYKKPLTTNNIYYLYNMVKNLTPPVVEASNLTIIKDKLTVNNSS